MHVVTGAFGYIGQHIARHLLERGESVKTITTHPEKPNPFGRAVEAHAYRFDRPEELVATLRGATALYNTYWIRFEHGGATFEQAVRNTATLFDCARRAGVGKVVHISVTHASLESPLPYYRGKALQERALAESGLPHAIIRPTLVFGGDDILVNNIAWLIRTFPVFPIFGSGAYRLQPIHVDDLAKLAVTTSREPASRTFDATGPQTFTFEELVSLMISRIRPGVRRVHVPPGLGILLGRIIGPLVGDVLLTDAELRGLMDSLLTSPQPPAGTTRFTDWLEENKAEVGTSYTSELARHFHWRPAA